MKRLLIIDDDQDMVDSFCMLMENENLDIVEASSGEKAIQILSEKKVDYILLDIELDGIDGWETLRKIKADKTLSNIPIAMLTATPLTRGIMKEQGFNYIVDYITKPFTKKDIMETLKQWKG